MGFIKDGKVRQCEFSGVEKGKKEKRATILSAIRLALPQSNPKVEAGKRF